MCYDGRSVAAAAPPPGIPPHRCQWRNMGKFIQTTLHHYTSPACDSYTTCLIEWLSGDIQIPYYYLRQGGYVIVVVCLFVCLLATLRKTFEWICMKFSGNVGNWPVNKQLNFGGNPDHGFGSRSVSRHWQDVPWRRYACPSASSHCYLFVCLLVFLSTVIVRVNKDFFGNLCLLCHIFFDYD